ncbi:MAG: serine hydrolase [Candidatus Lokiarchaeota archaeon]|nr:serine hydrolase [Candidatus Lokiarchaeota archaeon]
MTKENEELVLSIKNLLEKFNKSDLILDEIEGWDGIIQFILTNNFHFYIFNSGQKLEYVEGKADDPDFTLKTPPNLAKKLFDGEMDVRSFFDAITNKTIEFQGDSSHFMKLTVLLEYLEENKSQELKSGKEDWIVEAPENHGMKSDLLDDAARKLKEIDINRNSFVVIRHGVLIYEEYYGQRSYETRKRWHYDIASVTKTIAALVIGVAVTKGLFSVDDLITDWIPNPAKGIVPGSKIRHLMTQTSETEPAGTNFKYNSEDEVNTLGKIITVASGVPSKEFANENLFQPLGVRNYSWGEAVADMTDLPVGYGMKISSRDAAKLGQLMLNKGKWNGVKFISEQYINEMVKPSFLDVNSGYGYLLWLNNSLGKWVRPFKQGTGRMIQNAPEDMFMATGFYGRFIFVIPSLNIVIVTFGKKFVMESLDTAREFYNAIAPALPS